jgi:hypothetical protein
MCVYVQVSRYGHEHGEVGSSTELINVVFALPAYTWGKTRGKVCRRTKDEQNDTLTKITLDISFEEGICMHPFPLSRYQPWNINNQEQVFDVKGIKVDVSSNVRNIMEKCRKSQIW